MKRFAAFGVLLLTTSCISIPLGSRAGNPATGEAETTGATADATPAAPPPPANYVLILDSSGSMKTADMSGGVDRMTAARDAGRRFVEALPPDAKVSLVTYGDQTPEEAPKESGCGDVSVKLPLGTERNIGPVLDQLRPTGWTPISLALTKAAEQAPAGETTSIVLVSDGEDSCAPPDPCETAAAVVSGKPNLTISTLGVRASSEQLTCIADRGNGLSLPADNAAQLARRLPALSDPAAAADMLSPQGVQKVRPGTEYGRIREMHPDFPDLPPVAAAETIIRVIWRNCEWLFDDKQVLREIVLQSGPTIDGITAGDPVASLDVLGMPLKTEPAPAGPGVPAGAETRFYAADERLGLAWKVTVADGKVITIILCTCLPTAPCPPSDDDARRLQADPSMQITTRKCTADNQWAALESTFQNGDRSGWLVLKRNGASWEKVTRITHQGDCFSIPKNAPRGELNTLLDNGQWCSAPFAIDELKDAKITTDGLGPLRLGRPASELQAMGLVRRPLPTDACAHDWFLTSAVPTEIYADFENNRVKNLLIKNSQFPTASGVRVGSTRAELLRTYPNRLTAVSSPGSGETLAFTSGRRKVEFAVWDEGTGTPTVGSIWVADVDDVFMGGC